MMVLNGGLMSEVGFVQVAFANEYFGRGMAVMRCGFTGLRNNFFAFESDQQQRLQEMYRFFFFFFALNGQFFSIAIISNNMRWFKVSPDAFRMDS